MDHRSHLGVFFVFLLSLTTLVSRGQSITGDLVVTALDSQNAVVPGANLRLTAVDTDLRYEGTTDANGSYLFGQLKPGAYRLTASAPGFQEARLVNIRIDLGQRAKVDVNFKIGNTATSIEVSAGAATLLNVENATIGQVIQERTLNELPLNGRNFVQLAQLSPAVTPVAAGHSSATVWTGRSDTTVSIAGLRESNVSYLLNGIETRNSRFGNPGIRPSVDAIQEFRVQHSTFGAEYGRSAAVINTTLRSGTNEVHLTLFELLRNRALDANNYFSNSAGQELPAFTQNNFGTTLAAPVILPKLYDGRNRTFFMFNYEGYRQRETVTKLSLYPSAAQWAGNLADDSAGTGLYPTSSSFCSGKSGSVKCANAVDPTTGTAFANNVIPASRLSSVMQKFKAFTPMPNLAVASGASGFPSFNTISTPASINDWDQYNVRIDHRISDKDLLYGSFSNSDEYMLDPGRRFLGGMTYPMSNRLWTMTYSRILSPNLINEFRFGFNDSKTYQMSEGSNGVDYAKTVIGLANTSSNPFDYGVPYVNFDGFNSIGTTPEAIGADDTNFQFTDNLSWVKGKHNLQVGVQMMREMYYQITDFNGNPTFNFDGRYTGMQGIGLADMLMGTPYSASGAIGDSSQDERSNYWGGYIQDSWRVAKNFTINLGLRYEYSGPPSEIRNRAIYFSPELGKVVTAASGAVRSSVVDPDYNNYAPRLGLSYSPAFLKNTVIRAGVGTYFSTDQLNGEQWKIVGGSFYQAQTVYSDPGKPTLSMNNMMPSFTASTSTSPFTWDRLSRTPYVNQWSFNIQHSFSDSTMLELSYLGSTSQKGTLRRNYNIATMDPTGTIPIAQRTRYSDYGAILMAYNGGWSSYQAFTASLNKRFSSGLSFLASYTWAKSLDLGDFSDASVSANFKNWDRGHSAFDVPQRVVLSYTWELPFGKGKAFLNRSGVLGALVGGWQVNGISTFAKGQFESVTMASDWVNLGSFTISRPDAIGNYKANRSYPNHYLETTAFDYPRDSSGKAIHVEGNSGRNTIEMPGLCNFDMSLFRNIRFKERYTAQIRAEGFNVFNHTQWGSPDLTWGSPTFGQISSTLVDARRVQLGLKLSF